MRPIRRDRGGDQAEYAHDVDRDAEQSAAQTRRSGGDRADRAARTYCSRWPTTRSPRRTFSGRSTLGFDIVVHSVTKYLNGHSDMIGGIAVVGDDDALAERLGFLQNAVGAIGGPFDSFLACAA